MAKNLCGKQVGKYGMSQSELRATAYEVWSTPDGSWTWYVLKKYQADDSKPFARWFTYVFSPMCPNGELGDTYAAVVKANGVLIRDNKPTNDSPIPGTTHVGNFGGIEVFSVHV